MSAEDEFFDAKVKVLSEQIENHAGDKEEKMFVKACILNMDLVKPGNEIATRKVRLNADLSASWPYVSEH